ncbi:TPA: HNH endonuclease, partial [Bacillus anthracis]|nr:HNH endonuclease [Bacillus anthracis]
RINKQTGYIQIDLTKNNKKKTFRVHRLVAVHFLPNPENKPEVNHEDGNKENNNVGNLKWVTPKENMNHAYKFGLSKGMKGESNPSVKLKEEDVVYIKNNFKSFDKEFGAKALGKKFGVSGSHISGIISGDKWGHLN